MFCLIGTDRVKQNLPHWHRTSACQFGTLARVNLPNRIKELREARGWSQTKLSTLVHCHHTKIGRLETGKQQLTKLWMDRLAAVFGISPTDLIARPDTPLTPPTSDATSQDLIEAFGEQYAPLPVFDVRLSAGPGSLVVGGQAPVHHEMFRLEWLRALFVGRLDQLALVRVDGESMEPTLHNGDVVLIDRSASTAYRDGLYAILIGDALSVKRVQIDIATRTLSILSDNQYYDPQRGVDPADVTIRGRVIWLSRAIG